MLASGNGSAETCIKNLLSITKTENPFARDKGVGTDHIDRTVGAEEILSDNIEELIDEYEPRLAGDTISIDYKENGDFDVMVEVSNAYEESDGE